MRTSQVKTYLNQHNAHDPNTTLYAIFFGIKYAGHVYDLRLTNDFAPATSAILSVRFIVPWNLSCVRVADS